MRTAAVVNAVLAHFVIIALPSITGVLARALEFKPDMIGAFATFNTLGSTVGGLSAIAVMRRASPRATVTLGLLLLLATSIGSAAYGQPLWLISLRAVGGLGTGLAASACVYVYSRRDRERNAAANILGQTALAGIVITAIPAVVHQFGWRAMFLGFAVLIIPAQILAWYFPTDYKEESPEQAVVPAVHASRWLMWQGIVSVALAGMATLSMWTYLDRIGVAAGISDEVIARSLSICTVFGFFSSAIVIVLGERVTRTVPLIVCLILNLAGVAAAGSSIPWVFTVAVSTFYFSLPIYLTAQFGAIMGRLRSRRFVVFYSLAGSVGALGPTMSGLIAKHYGFAAIRWIAIVLMLAASIMLWTGFIRRHPSTLRPPKIYPLGIAQHSADTKR